MMATTTSNHTVRHFREVLFWPVQMMPLVDAGNAQPHWEFLAQDGEDNPWRRLKDRFQADELDFDERHYKEFVTFLPYVQRFIYGETHNHMSDNASDPPGGSARSASRSRSATSPPPGWDWS